MSYILLNSSAYFHNLNLIQNAVRQKSADLSSPCEVCVVLKDNAYGHGLVEMGGLALKHGIAHAFVKNFDEANALNAAYPNGFKSINAFYCDFNNLPAKIAPNIVFTINNEASILALKKHGAPAKVELKVNTGMNRNGVESDKLEQFLEQILEARLELFGVFTHNGYGDELDCKAEFDAQNAKFEAVKKRVLDFCQKREIKRPRFHSLASAGAFRSEKISDDIVRIGIASYGYLGAELASLCPSLCGAELRPVLSLWAEKITTRTLAKGEKIGYGGKSVAVAESVVSAIRPTLAQESVIKTQTDFAADSTMLAKTQTNLTADSSAQDVVVSTYDIGYGDGFPRVSEVYATPFLTTEGVEILPRSSMECFSAFTHAPKLCVFANADYVAKFFSTISYEILTNLSPNLKRKIV